MLHGDLRYLYYGEVCIACLHDGIHTRPLVAVPDVDEAGHDVSIDSEADHESPRVVFSVIDRILTSIHVVAGGSSTHHSSGGNESRPSDDDVKAPHLPPFRILISDGECDSTPEAHQRVILSGRSNHTFLDKIVKFDDVNLELIFVEPRKIFFIRLDTYSRRLTTFRGAFWLPLGAAHRVTRSDRSSAAPQEARPSVVSFVVVPPSVTTGTLGTRFQCTLSFGAVGGENDQDVTLEVVALRKAPVPPQRLVAYLLELPFDATEPSTDAPYENIVIESNPAGLLHTIGVDHSAPGESMILGTIGSVENHNPSVRKGLRMLVQLTKRGTNQRLWSFLHGGGVHPIQSRFAVILVTTFEELHRDYHETYVVPNVGALLKSFRGEEIAGGATNQNVTTSVDTTWLYHERLIEPNSYRRLLEWDAFKVQPDGSSVTPPDEPFLRILLRHEPEYQSTSMLLVQPVAIRNLQVLVVNAYNETLLLEEEHHVPFIGPYRDLRVDALFGIRRFISDDITWVGGDSLTVHLFFDTRDGGCPSSEDHPLAPSSESADGYDVGAALDVHSTTATGHNLLMFHRERLEPRYYHCARGTLTTWYHHAVRDSFERAKVFEGILHTIELSEGHVEDVVYASAECTRNGHAVCGAHGGPPQLFLSRREGKHEGRQWYTNASTESEVVVSIPFEMVITAKVARGLPLLEKVMGSDAWNALGRRQQAHPFWKAERQQQVMEIALFTLCGGEDPVSGLRYHQWVETLAYDDTRENYLRRPQCLETMLSMHGLGSFVDVLRTRQQYVADAFKFIKRELPWLVEQVGLTEALWLQRVHTIEAMSVDLIRKTPRTFRLDDLATEELLTTELFVAPVLSWCTHSNVPTAVVTMNVTRRSVDISMLSDCGTSEEEGQMEGCDDPAVPRLQITCDWSARQRSSSTTLDQVLQFHAVLDDGVPPVVDVSVPFDRPWSSMEHAAASPPHASRTFWLTEDDGTRDALIAWLIEAQCGSGSPMSSKNNQPRKWRQPVRSEREQKRCAYQRAITLLEKRQKELPLVPLPTASASVKEQYGEFQHELAHMVEKDIARILRGSHLVLALHVHVLRELLLQEESHREKEPKSK